MIKENYYNGFATLCKRNKKIMVIPSRESLVENGCEISSICYIVLKDGKVYNPSSFDPDIIEDKAVRASFFEQKSVNIEEKKLTEELTKVCYECNSEKSLENFRRKAGRGLNYHDVCLACEVKDRTEAMTSLVRKDKSVTESTTSAKVQKPKYISVETAKKLAIEAYGIGYMECEQQYKSENITIDDLFGGNFIDAIKIKV